MQRAKSAGHRLPDEPGGFPSFDPPRYLHNPDLQTFYGSSKIRLWRTGSIKARARSTVITTEKNIRLTGAFSKTPAPQAKGLVILLHGWEGSMASTYVLTTGQYLLDRGFDIFRLNLRDHGPTHHLNRGLFYATLLEEVCAAVAQVTRTFPSQAVYLCGFSLGGNFVLRMARQWSRGEHENPGIRHSIAISPVLDPSAATDAIDRHPIIRYYFLRKWRRSLSKKQRCFPHEYNFTRIIDLPTVRAMTVQLLREYSDFSSIDEYFDGYNITGEALKAVTAPATIITAADDPIIPVVDFYHLPANPNLRLMIQRFGGHNGFIFDWRGNTWYEEFMHQVLLKAGSRHRE